MLRVAIRGLTIGGVAIKLYNVNGTVVGSTALSAPAVATDASVVFSLAVNGSGIVTLTQFQQIDHPIADDPSATDAPFADHPVFLANGLVNLTASSTITDNDGDIASDSETIDLGGNVRFDDHGPTVTTTGTVPTLTVDETDLARPMPQPALPPISRLYMAPTVQVRRAIRSVSSLVLRASLMLPPARRSICGSMAPL